MKYLFLFLKKQFFFLLFLFLELIAFLMLANHNNYQRSSIINSTNAITGAFNSGYSAITDYFYLREENRRLSDENAMLRNQGVIIKGNADSLLITDSSYRFMAARVISNTNHARNNYIMIDKGRLDGIEKETGLISPDGIAGIVIEVTNHYATAISILHKNARISARFKNSGQMVNVVWGGIDYKTGTVEDIPTHVFPRKGDTVVTSGYSFVFPENILIGTIGDNIETGGTLNKAELVFSTDFNNLGYVYVCKKLDAAEINRLKTLYIDE